MKKDTITFAGGCFWCTEAIFKRLKGIIKVIPGYAGGEKENPSYREVSTGETGYAESIQIEFDPSVIPLSKILDVFWHTHNPTTINQQGADIGSQYRSVIFYNSEKQRKTILKSKERLEREKVYKEKIVTEILPFKNFYKAEDYHIDFYDKNRDYPYCRFVIDPKIQKLLVKYNREIKEEFL